MQLGVFKMQMKIMNSFINRSDSSGSPTVNLRPGQIFHGSITQLYSGALAKLQVGQMQLTAQLEAQLEKGEKYWFRVAQGDGLPRLKVIENLDSLPNNKNQNIQLLLQQLGLPANNLNEKMMQHFSQQNLPFTKENITQAAPLLSISPMSEKDTLQLIGSMMQRELPITKDVFLALASLQSSKPMADTMNQLAAQLNTVNSPQATQLQQQLQQLLHPNQENSAEQWKGIMQMLAGGDKGFNDQTVQLLHALGVTRHENFSELIQQFNRLVLRNGNSPVIKEMFPGALSIKEDSVPLQQFNSVQLFQHIIRHLQVTNTGMILQLMQLLGSEKPQTAMMTLHNLPESPPAEHMREQWNILKAITSSVTNWGKESSPLTEQAHPLRMLLQQLGFNYENSVRTVIQQGTHMQELQQAGTLKANLLALLQNTQVPQGIREQADYLLNRITGFQIINQEQQGPLHHLLVQLPVSFMEKYQDITIQWSGKQNTDGVMDEDHCRILFYLHLENLKETVVDVQIQNRIVTINIFNENEKPASLNKLWGPMLRDKLTDINYQLSGINWKMPDEEQILPVKSTAAAPTEPKSYKGVDYRI